MVSAREKEFSLLMVLNSSNLSVDLLRETTNQMRLLFTSMLLDFEVLTIQDIIEMLEDDQTLDERLQEAEDLIKEENYLGEEVPN